MSDLTVYKSTQPERPRMNRTETKRTVDLYAKLGHARRFLLLEMFERSAHISMGYANFSEFCNVQLGVEHDKQYISKLIQAARIERVVSEQLSSNMLLLDEIKTPKITIRVAQILGKAPEDKWKPIYDKFAAINSGDTYLSNSALTELKHLVKDALPTPADPPAPTPELPKQKHSPPAPIVPPTYDRGPEFDDEQEEAALLAEANAEHARVDALLDLEDDVDTGAMTVAEPEDASELGGYVNSAVEDRIPDTSPVASGGILCDFTAFLKQFIVAYKTADQNAFHELMQDAVRLIREYGP